VQADAGVGSGFSDDDFAREGAAIVGDATAVFATTELVVKVKEPQPDEVAMLRADQLLFTYLHLAPDHDLTQGLLDAGATAIAYETITDHRGRLPLLAPMSEVAGRLATQAGAYMLAKAMGGRGVLLGGVPGVAPAIVTVIGGGVVGENAARVAVGMGADVRIYDRSIERLRELDTIFGRRVSTRFASAVDLEQAAEISDLVIGAVLIQGARAPYVLTRRHLAFMKPSAVVVDVAIDQGGCFETSQPTTHSNPTYTVDGITHYCVANMPGAVPVTSTAALTNATMPYVKKLADLGLRGAAESDPGFAAGLNVLGGRPTNEAVAMAQGRDNWLTVSSALREAWPSDWRPAGQGR
jgi:alanine dehydrogenase